MKVDLYTVGGIEGLRMLQDCHRAAVTHLTSAAEISG